MSLGNIVGLLVDLRLKIEGEGHEARLFSTLKGAQYDSRTMQDCSSHNDEGEDNNEEGVLVVQNCLGFGLKIFRNNKVFAKCPVQICPVESVACGDEGDKIEAGMSLFGLSLIRRHLLTTNIS
jgi:hypothetical protein